jgi:LSD1 subclass zinc finger protein
MAKVTQHKCPKCGAPLVLTKGVSDVACQYCRTVVHVEWGKKAPVEQPPPLTIYVKNPLPAFVPLLIVFSLLVPLGIGALVFMGTLVGGVATAVQGVPVVSFGQGKQTDVKSLPVTCGLNQEIVISGQKFEGPGPLVTGEVNCKVKIKDSTLKSADIVVLAKNLVEITIENSTLEGKEAAVKLVMNSKLFAKKNAVLKGEEAAILAGVNSEISLEEASVEAVEAAIQADTNLTLSGTKSKIVGKEFGVRGTGSNLKIDGKELSIKGGRAAIQSQSNLKLEQRGGLIEGDETAILLKSSNADIKLTRGARIKARDLGIKGETNLHLEMEDASIEAGDVAIQSGVNPKLDLGPGSRVSGKRVALKVGINLELELSKASIESEGIAICAPYNIEIRAREGKISGGTDAFRFERRPNELELLQTTITGKQRFDARGCGATR